MCKKATTKRHPTTTVVQLGQGFLQRNLSQIVFYSGEHIHEYRSAINIPQCYKYTAVL